MKYKYFVIILFSVATLYSCNPAKLTQASSGGHNSSFNGEWKLTDSWVFDSTLVFERVDKTITRPEYEEVFIIEGSSMKHEVRTEIGMCGNGMFFLDSASFVSSSRNVEITLQGGYMVESTFEYIAKYKVQDQTENGFSLRIKSVLMNEKKSFYE
jgi:hypothetical protein